MNTGVWVWPEAPRAQTRVLREVAGAQHLVPALTAIGKSKDGLSNSELDYLIGDNSNWMTLWVVRQLTSLGFIEMKVDYFGEAARYRLTDLGISALTKITGQPIKKPVVPSPAAPTKPPTPTPLAAPASKPQPASGPAPAPNNAISNASSSPPPKEDPK